RGLVPVVWIEQTTTRLQGGCSTTELNGRSGRDFPPVQRHRQTQRLVPTQSYLTAVYKTAALPAELSRLRETNYAPYLMRRRVGLPPPGFFGGSELGGAGSAAGGLLLAETDSVSPFVCTAGFAPSTSKVMPWPVSRA